MVIWLFFRYFFLVYLGNDCINFFILVLDNSLVMEVIFYGFVVIWFFYCESRILIVIISIEIVINIFFVVCMGILVFFNLKVYIWLKIL